MSSDSDNDFPQVIEMSVTTNSKSPSQNDPYLDDQTTQSQCLLPAPYSINNLTIWRWL